MFNKNFYPTPPHLLELMTLNINFKGKFVLDPSAGKGDILDYVKLLGAEEVYGYENDENLISILKDKCTLIGKDWLESTSIEISHLDYIIMNPPFDNGDKHILHAWEIAPEGCEIIVICNANTLREDYTTTRKKLNRIITSNGSSVTYIEEAFTASFNAERTTNVEIAFFKLYKPGVSDSFDYNSFYLEEEEETAFKDGLIAYSEIRDIVGRYVASIQSFQKMNKEMKILGNYASSVGLNGDYSLHLHNGDSGIHTTEDFLKSLQKAAWGCIFKKLNIERMVTTQVKEKLNKFVETNYKVPFTEKNIFVMLSIISGTFKENMDISMVKIFDLLTERYAENRYNVEGWKTNKAHCIGKKFILPSAVKQDWGKIRANSYGDYLTDLQKSMSYLIGEKYNFKDLEQFLQPDKVIEPFVATQEEFDKLKENKKHLFVGHPEELITIRLWAILKEKEKTGVEVEVQKEFGKWYDFGFFMIKGFKKGTLHCMFKDERHWELLNRRVNEIKGSPLPEKI